jgi:uncharacterized membrane protein
VGEDDIGLHPEHEHIAAPFGADAFGRGAERVARFFGTPQYILTQTAIVIVWIVFNGFEIFVHFDKYPFILLNLAFSTQAAYAAPLILLAQTRQADRDKISAMMDAKHREDLAQRGLHREATAERQIGLLKRLIEENTELTEEVNRLTKEIHRQVVS